MSQREYYQIIPGTINIDPPFELDELGEHPPLLRSVFRCECMYDDHVGDIPVIVESVSMDGIILVDDPVPVDVEYDTDATGDDDSTGG